MEAVSAAGIEYDVIRHGPVGSVAEAAAAQRVEGCRCRTPRPPGRPPGPERGTITPFRSRRPWPVIADERTRGRTISLGAGERGVALRVGADAAIEALGGSFADVTDLDS